MIFYKTVYYDINHAIFLLVDNFSSNFIGAL